MSNWLLPLLFPRRRLFVSYHHAQDQAYYNAFSSLFDYTWQWVCDRSLRQLYGNTGTDPEYVIRQIRERHITGTSCTLVLCGACTAQRKFVDWEICATLNKGHGLIGIDLQPIPGWVPIGHRIPDRLGDNYGSGYAVRHSWYELRFSPWVLAFWIEDALSRDKSLIDNSRPTMRRNRSIWGT